MCERQCAEDDVDQQKWSDSTVQRFNAHKFRSQPNKQPQPLAINAFRNAELAVPLQCIQICRRIPAIVADPPTGDFAGGTQEFLQLLHAATERKCFFDDDGLAGDALAERFESFAGLFRIGIKMNADEIDLGCDLRRNEAGKMLPIARPRQEPNGHQMICILRVDSGGHLTNPLDGDLLAFAFAGIEGDELHEIESS